MVNSIRIVFLMASIFSAQAYGASVGVELNRLDVRTGGCGVQMVVTNSTGKAFTGFALDLVVFDSGGQITRRTVLNVAPVRASKTTVYAFDLKDLKCADIGSILLNDVVDCAQGSGPIADCVDDVGVTSVAKVPFKK
ncbi:MAG: hypothetical protein ACI8W7_002748 [Gammaproteobacteria bacterium]|jgi:hypothetical protein